LATGLGQSIAPAPKWLKDIQAGPYFRSRAAAPGDGIVGGASRGYWVQLHSNGMVRIKRLNPHADSR
jgi:hypothetical protein